MTIVDLTTLVALILAISLASERLVTIIKTAIPWLADEKKTEAQEVDLSKDAPRRLIVQLLAFVCAWTTSSFLDSDGFNLFGSISFGNPPYNLNVFILGLLASGGSAFWTNILGYTKAVKDIKIQERANAGLKFHIMASSVGETPIGGGQVVGATGKLPIAKKKAESMQSVINNNINSDSILTNSLS